MVSSGKPPFFDRPRTHDGIFWTLVVVCLVLFATDLVYHKHTHFAFEHWLGFHALFGFVAYCSIVFGAKLLRRWVKRDEDYYD